MKLEDLKIIVTGAASGMGAHFARRLHEAGAKVAAGDVNEALLAELDRAVQLQPAIIEFLRQDMTNAVRFGESVTALQEIVG